MLYILGFLAVLEVILSFILALKGNCEFKFMVVIFAITMTVLLYL